MRFAFPPYVMEYTRDLTIKAKPLGEAPPKAGGKG
jgi:hypothetical protein